MYKIRKYRPEDFDFILDKMTSFNLSANLDDLKRGYLKTPKSSKVLCSRYLKKMTANKNECFMVYYSGAFLGFCCFDKINEGSCCLRFAFKDVSQKRFVKYNEVLAILVNKMKPRKVYCEITKRNNFKKYLNFIENKLNFKKNNATKYQIF